VGASGPLFALRMRAWICRQFAMSLDCISSNPLQTSDSPLIEANGVLSDASPAHPADN